jgi:hypothetical protein
MIASARRRLPALEAHLIVLWILLFSCVSVSTASARTWYIRVDGGGNAPTIQAGIDSAVSGDVVLVGPGTYAITTPIEMKSGIVLQSEQGPSSTMIKKDSSEWSVYCGIQMRNVANSEVHGFWIKPFYGMGGSCLEIWDSNTIIVADNILESSTWSLYLYYSDYVYVHNNLIMGEGGSAAGVGVTVWPDPVGAERIEIRHNIIVNRVDCNGDPYISTVCNDILGNPGCINMAHNFALDPQFCGVSGAMNYYLQSDSPCAPGNDPVDGYCGPIGPLPVGCGTVDVEKKSWGEIKTLYQE